MNSLPDNPHVRPMAETDLDRVEEIARSLLGAPQWPRSAYLTALRPGGVPRRLALVAETKPGGTVAGFAVASLLPPESELETIAVDSRFQRRGIAQAIFRALAAGLRGAGATVILLEVRASNRQALAFYRSLGFAETGRRPGYYADPVEDAVLMRLEAG